MVEMHPCQCHVAGMAAVCTCISSHICTYTNVTWLPLQQCMHLHQHHAAPTAVMHASTSGAMHLLFPTYFHGSNICTCINSNAHAHASNMLQPCICQHQKQCVYLCQQQCMPPCQHHAAPFAAMHVASSASTHAPTGSLPIRMKGLRFRFWNTRHASESLLCSTKDKSQDNTAAWPRGQPGQPGQPCDEVTLVVTNLEVRSRFSCCSFFVPFSPLLTKTTHTHKVSSA